MDVIHSKRGHDVHLVLPRVVPMEAMPSGVVAPILVAAEPQALEWCGYFHQANDFTMVRRVSLCSSGSLCLLIRFSCF